MRAILTLLTVVMTCIAASGYKYSYSFDRTPISEAIVRISKDHPEININFLYRELDNYKTSSKINTDDLDRALRQIIGLNPVSIISKGDIYYIEALQHGKFRYFGNATDDENKPVIGASVMLLSPRDSTVITYGVTDSEGRFSIPCDKKKVIAKITCVGYKPYYINRPPFAIGSITMQPTPVQLSTINVEADNTVLSADKNIYIPTSSQKNASQDATDLLRRMAIPQLVINPGDNTIKDVFGNNVSVFINYHEAQPDELKGMKLTDVRKIEFIEFPTDPRFNGEQRVVNFIVREYEYGGYTKASESFRTLNGIFNTADVFSRFTYKKMTYDIYAAANNQDYHHSGADNSAVYRLENDAAPVSVTRNETFSQSSTRSDEYPLSFRASYYSPKFTARNTLSFTRSATPEQTSSGELHVSNRPESDYTFSRTNPNRHNTVDYQSNFWGIAGSNISFDISPSFRHTHRNHTSAYESSLLQSPIRNDITENTYNWALRANGRIDFGQKNQLSLSVGGGQNIYHLIYTGSNNTDDSYSNSFIGGEARYRYQTRKISASTFIGFGWDRNSMNRVNTSDLYPRFGANARLSLGNNSQISAYLSYQTSTPGISMKANDIVQSNEFMYLTANPRLKNWRNLNSNLSYNRFFNNSLSIAAFAGYEQDFNRVATVYRPYNNGEALLRDFINDGSYRHYYAGLSANYKLFNNSLQLYANLTQNAYEITGSYKDSYYPLRLQLQGVYYWKTFSLLASWGNPQRTLTENSNIIIRGRNFHMLSIGWGNGVWTLNLAAKNIFNKGWRSECRERHTPLYTEYQQLYNPSAHPSLTLSLTYTIGYGKQIRRLNEIPPRDTPPSAIIQ